MLWEIHCRFFDLVFHNGMYTIVVPFRQDRASRLTPPEGEGMLRPGSSIVHLFFLAPVDGFEQKNLVKSQKFQYT